MPKISPKIPKNENVPVNTILPANSPMAPAPLASRTNGLGSAVRNRIISFALHFAVLTFLYFVFRNSSWVGGTHLHTLMELAATLLAAIVGIVALLRFYTKRNNTFLFVGAGFLGTALLDGYHAVVTSNFFDQMFPSALPSLLPWSWSASRTFLSVLLFLSWYAWTRESKLGKEKGLVNDHLVYIVVFSFTLLSFVFFAFFPLPRAYYPELIFGRPGEFVAGIFFFLALIGYLKKDRWKHDSFEYWLILSLIVGFMAQALFMPSSFTLFDGMFDIAHGLKKASYIYVLTGLLISMYRVFTFAEKTKARVASQNYELRDAKLAAEADTAKSKAILESIGDGLIVTDTNRKILLTNRAANTLLNVGAGELIGKEWPGALSILSMSGDVLPVEDLLITKALTTGKEMSTSSYQYTRKDGSKFPVAVTVAPVMLVGEISGGIIVFRDITAEKYLDNAKSEFISIASHQLRTPLSAIRWDLEMLLSGEIGTLPEEQKKLVTDVFLSNARMIALVGALLNVSRIESGRIIVDPHPTHLGVLLSNALKGLKTELEAKNIRTTVDVMKDLPEIMVDESLIKAVYVNLLSNSIAYNRQSGHIKISISKEGEDIVSRITDSGYGIPKDLHKKVFTKFFRGDNIVDIVTDGTGLGLYLAKAIVNSSGGSIGFTSEQNKETTFWFKLPISGSKPNAGEVPLSS